MKKLSIQTKAERLVDYTYVQNGAKRVCFMFSGLGYTYDKPLFYYASMLMKKHDIDVVHVEYSYEPELFEESYDMLLKEIMNDVQPVVDEITKNGQYEDVIFLGKSIGTIPLIGGLMNDVAFSEARWIALTPLIKLEPLREVLNAGLHRGLLIIGDQDPHYDEQLVNELQGLHHVEVVPNADHSLEMVEADPEESIVIIDNAIRTIDHWIAR